MIASSFKPSLKPLLFANLIAILLLLSWLFPLTRPLWDYLDALTYLHFHHFFLQTEFWQKFWAVMNSRIVDNLSHTVFILILIAYIFSDKAQYIRKRTLQSLFVLFAVITTILISKYIQHELATHTSIKRPSPGLVLGHTITLSKVLPNLKNVKDASQRSFPGDHAATLILLTGFIFCLTKNITLRTLALLATLLFTLPRLISGGHWLTDILMGSFPIAIFALTLWLLLYSLTEKLIIHFKSKKQI